MIRVLSCPDRAGKFESGKTIKEKAIASGGNGLLFYGGGSRIRTYEGISQQIYSLPRLTASVSPLIRKKLNEKK